MSDALGHPDWGYYASRDPLGRAGDFVTAPEISQVFGELIGLWCAVVWRQMGEPSRIALVELGPGRGTLMADALRAVRVVQGFRAAIEVHLVDSSPTLRAAQAAALASAGVPVTWHDGTATLPKGPAIVIANEFVDAFAVDHWRVRTREHAELDAWEQRVVTLGRSGHLSFDWRPPSPDLEAWFRHAFLPVQRRRFGGMPTVGEIIETRLRPVGGIEHELSNAWRDGSAALIIDYGHEAGSVGETLQGLRAHAPEHPLASPGEADLTAVVDFAELRAILARAVEGSGKRAPIIDGPVTQAHFLSMLGIVERASRLMADNPSEALAIEAAIARLLAEPGMGNRFKVLGMRSPDVAPLPGLQPPTLQGRALR